MFYTGKGDDGSTGLFGTEKRVSKASPVPEALGATDELNSLLGVCKVKSAELLLPNGTSVATCIDLVQGQLFIAQAELAGTDKTIDKKRVEEMEVIIKEIEHSLPKIHTFRVSGGTELSALFDYARAVSRRTERRLVAAAEVKEIGLGTRGYFNRLSSLLYAFARLANAKSGITEQSPTYK